MAEISNLGYLVFGVSDLQKWEVFATEIVGMQVGEGSSDHSLTLRMDEYQSRLILEKGPEDDLKSAGWIFENESNLESYVSERKAKGLQISQGSSELAKARGVEKLYLCKDPSGVTHELAFGPLHAPLYKPFRSSVLLDGFETSLGIGHLLLVAKDYKQSVDFYNNLLGLRVSDFIRQEVAPGVVIDATFFHTPNGNHHSVATTFIPGAKKSLNHFMVQLKSLNDVGLAFDRCLRADVPVFFGIGHHPNNHMTSFYVVTPSGFAIECGWGGIVIDDENWEVKSYSQLSDWGHKPGAGFSL